MTFRITNSESESRFQYFPKPRRLILFGRWMRAREIAHIRRDDNRVVRPFAWGTEFIREHANGENPRVIFGEHTERVVARGGDFYALPGISGWQLSGGR